MKSTPCRSRHYLLLSAAALAMSSLTSHAALYYLKAGAGATNWGVASDWNSQQDGLGTNATTMVGNDFNSNGMTFGTPSGNAAFPGASLVLSGGTLNMRNSGTKTVSPLTVVGNVVITANTSSTMLSVVSFTASAGSLTTFRDIQGVTSVFSSQFLSFGTLTGDGDFALAAAAGVNPGGQKTFVLSATDATGFTGDVTWTGSNLISLQFGANNMVFGGGLVATDSNSRITLDQDVSFGSLSLNGTPLGAGTYSYAFLNENYDTIFNEGGSGSITVIPEPATFGFVLTGLGLVLLRRKTGPRFS